MKMRRIAYAMIVPVLMLMLALCLEGCQALQEGLRPRQETAVDGEEGSLPRQETAVDGEELLSAEEAADGKKEELLSAEEAADGKKEENLSAEEAVDGKEKILPAEEAVPGSAEETVPGSAEEAVPGSAEEKEESCAALRAGLGLPEEFDPGMVPAPGRDAWADVNEDIPFFSGREMEAARRLIETGGAFQEYGELDGAGRCTGAFALVGTETLPQEERENIGMVKPTGWHTVKYDGIDGNYLYNRCHLIGFQLTGQNANEKNLITGTRFMNIEGMLPFEDSVLAYVQGTGKHVLYRVTPVFSGDNLLADGVLMEARSVEDPLVQFCAFCYNIQPGVEIEYASGESRGPVFTGTGDGTGVSKGTGNASPERGAAYPAEGNMPAEEGQVSGAERDADAEREQASEGPVRSRGAQEQWDFIVNVNTGKFHLPTCASAEKISTRNRQEYRGTREELIEMGYQPCGICRP